MARFTKEIRKKIVTEFAALNGGVFDAALFLKHVEKTGESHPAWSWFEWNDVEAANEFRLNQARAFVRDLRVTVEIHDMGPGRSINVRTVETPLALSPMDGRANGGGYQIVDPNTPASQAALCREAAVALKAFCRRYELAIAVAGIPDATAKDLVARLERAGDNIDSKVVLLASEA